MNERVILYKYYSYVHQTLNHRRPFVVHLRGIGHLGVEISRTPFFCQGPSGYFGVNTALFSPL